LTDEKYAPHIGDLEETEIPDAGDASPFDEPVDPPSNPDNIDGLALQEELTALKDEFETMRNQLMRTMADFQNFRKRKEVEIQTLKSYAAEKLVLDLLPVLDNFHRTVEALQQGSSLESIKSGIIAVERQFLSALESNNVVPIPAHGQPFDPELHEAIAHEPSTEHPEDTVIHVLEPGYKMVDRIIRPARVRVSKKP
jgi:molecular chaperone GrpE